MSAADDYEHALGGLRGHIVYGEQTAGDTPIAWVQVKVALPYLRDAERALVAERTRAEAAEAEVARMTTERDAARAEAAGLRVIVDAVDELAFCDYAAEVESYSETAPGSHAAAQARAADAYGALVRMRDAWRETHGAIATPPTVAAESATVAPKGKR